jgi:hypothetical protein
LLLNLLKIVRKTDKVVLKYFVDVEGEFGQLCGRVVEMRRFLVDAISFFRHEALITDENATRCAHERFAKTVRTAKFTLRDLDRVVPRRKAKELLQRLSTGIDYLH